MRGELGRRVEQISLVVGERATSNFDINFVSNFIFSISIIVCNFVTVGMIFSLTIFFGYLVFYLTIDVSAQKRVLSFVIQFC